MRDTFPLELIEEIGSTSAMLKQRAAAGAAETALLALRQTAGHGRLGRAWHSIDGNLYLSVLLRPGCIAAPGHWSLLSAVALADTVRRHLPDPGDLRLKWPNDLLLGGAKLAGILLEAGMDREPWLVVGFGVNLAGAPAGLGRDTACLADVAPAPAPEAFARQLLAALLGWRRRYGQEGFAPVRDAWMALAHRPGDPVAVGLGTKRVQGRYRGIGPDGSLLLDGPGGRITVTSGEVE